MPIILNHDELLTVSEVTEITGHDRKYILKLAHCPEFQAEKIKGGYYFKKAVVDEYLEHRKSVVKIQELVKILKCPIDTARNLCEQGFLDAKKNISNEWEVKKSLIVEHQEKFDELKNYLSIYELSQLIESDTLSIRTAVRDDLIPSKTLHFNFAGRDFNFLMFENKILDLIKLTPHVDYYSETEIKALLKTTSQNVRKFRNNHFEQDSLIAVVNKELTYFVPKNNVDLFHNYLTPEMLAIQNNLSRGRIFDLIKQNRITEVHSAKDLFPFGKAQYLIGKNYSFLEKKKKKIVRKEFEYTQPKTPKGFVPFEDLQKVLNMSSQYIKETLLTPYQDKILKIPVRSKLFWFISEDLFHDFQKQILDFNDSIGTKECAILLSKFIPISSTSLNRMCKNKEIPEAFISSLGAIGAPQWRIPTDSIEKLSEQLKQFRYEFVELDEFVSSHELNKSSILYRLNNLEAETQRFLNKIYIKKSSISESFFRKPRIIFDPPKLNHKRTKEYYSASNLLKILLEQTKGYESRNKPIFWKAFKNFASMKLYATSSKGNSLKSKASNLFQVWTLLISELLTDLKAGIEKDITRVLKKNEAFHSARVLFAEFIGEAFYEQEIELKESFFVERTEVINKDKSVYDQTFMATLEFHARLIEIHTAEAIKDPHYANMWLYVLMHLSNIWRKGDLIFKLLPITPEDFEIDDLNWFNFNQLDKTKAQKILNHYTQIMERQRISKTGADLRYIFDPTTVQAVATALSICSFHQSRYNKDFLLFTFLTEYNTIAEQTSKHLRFFALHPELKAFQNRKMNRTISTYLFNLGLTGIADEPNLRLKVIQLARGHYDENSVSHYAMEASSMDSSLHDSSFDICTTGEFGWTYSLVHATILEDMKRTQTKEQRVESIGYIKEKFELTELEGLSKFAENYNKVKVKSLLNFLFELSNDERINLFIAILRGELPAKTKFGQCIKYPDCPFIGREHCFGCEFFVPQYLALIEATKELRRLAKEIQETKFALCALRDAKYAADICQLLDEARNCFDNELVEAFMPVNEQEIIENNIKNKQFLEIN